MLRGKTLWMVGLLALLVLGLSVRGGLAQGEQWEKLLEAGLEAYQRADYTKAEKLLKAALTEAEKFGPTDSRLATSLNNLAELYRDQGKYAEAEPLYKRSLAILEKALGPQHPDVATALENYAELLRKTQREAEAAKLDARARAIRAKYPQGSVKQ